jgi:hypothetical protein
MDPAIRSHPPVGTDACPLPGLGVGENRTMCLVKSKGILKLLSDADAFEEHIMASPSRKTRFLWLLH